MSDQAILVLAGVVFLFGWAAVILFSSLRSIRILPRMSAASTAILALAIVGSGFVAFFYLYAAILTLTIIASGFAGGLGMGLVRLRTILTERVHLGLAMISIGLEGLTFSGFAQFDLLLRIIAVFGLILLLSGKSVRTVTANLVGGLSRFLIMFMLGAAALFLPSLLPSFEVLLHGTLIAGVFVGLILSYFFRAIR